MMGVINKALSIFLIALFIFMVLTVCWQVISRFVLQHPSGFTEELARFQLIWISFGGAAYTFNNKMHVGIDLLATSLTGAAHHISAAVSWGACALFSGLVFTYGGGRLVHLTYELKQVSASLNLPMSLVYIIVPISGILIFLTSVTFMIESLKLAANDKKTNKKTVT